MLYCMLPFDIACLQGRFYNPPIEKPGQNSQ